MRRVTRWPSVLSCCRHSRVGPAAVGIMLRFNSPLRSAADAGEWVRVRGHELGAPLYDAATCALLYPFASPLPSGEICRVRVREELVRGARGECLMPRQPDGIFKSSTFRSHRAPSLPLGLPPC